MRRIHPGTLVLAAGALLLVAVLFADWYEPGVNAWTAFEVWDVVLAALGLAVLGRAAADLELWRGPVAPVGTPVLAGAAAAVVLLALLNHPPAAIGAGTEAGIWLALIAALLMVAGAVLSEARISLSLQVDRRPRAGTAAGADGAGDPAPAPPPPGPRDPLFGDGGGAPDAAAAPGPGTSPPAPAPRPAEDAATEVMPARDPDEPPRA